MFVYVIHVLKYGTGHNDKPNKIPLYSYYTVLWHGTLSSDKWNILYVST